MAQSIKQIKVRRTNRLIAHGVLGFLFFLYAALARAELQSHTVSLPAVSGFYSLADFSDGDTVIDSLPISGLPKFDPALGTLNSVTVTIDAEGFYDIFVEGDAITDNTQPHALGYSSNSVGVELVYDDSGTGYVQSSLPLLDSLSCNGFAGDDFPCAEYAFDLAFWSEMDLPVTRGPDPYVESDFVGSGDVSVLELWFVIELISVTTDNVDNNIGTISGGLNEFSTNEVTINYDYTPSAGSVAIPMPVWALFGLSVLCLAVVSHRRKQIY